MGLDGTILDNTIFWLWQKGRRGKAGTELWEEFVSEELSGLNAGAIDYLKWLKEHKIEVFFISSRSENQREVTLSNLKKLGINAVNDRLFFLGEGGRIDLEKKDIFYEHVKSSYNLLLAIEDDFSIFLNTSSLLAQLKSSNPVLFSTFFRTF